MWGSTLGDQTSWFRYEFELPVLAGLVGQGLIIADDEFTLFVNGRRLESAILTENQRPNEQPLPIFLDFSQVLVRGTNVPQSCASRQQPGAA